jgi:hypothetical protein
VQELYRHANTSATASVLLHKIMRAVRAEGVREGRALLNDWLVVFTADYQRNMLAGMASKDIMRVRAGPRGRGPLPVLTPMPIRPGCQPLAIEHRVLGIGAPFAADAHVAVLHRRAAGRSLRCVFRPAAT